MHSISNDVILLIELLYAQEKELQFLMIAWMAVTRL